MKLLHLDSSIQSDGSVTREVSAAIVARLKQSSTEVIYHDLAAENPPHITPAVLPSAHRVSKSAGPLDGPAQAIRDASDAMLAEFMAADVVVIGAPMYNFTIPSQLKTWIDRIVIAGKTFSYGANGAEGLAGGKRILVAIARGGFYGPETAYVSAEHAESYLRSVFGFIGVTNLEFILVEGLAMGEETKTKAMKIAQDTIAQLAL